MQPIAIEAFSTKEPNPGDPSLLRCDEEGVPRLVQKVGWSEEAGCYLIALVDGSSIAIPGTGCGGMYFPDHDMSCWRIEEIVERNWVELIKNRKAAEYKEGVMKKFLSRTGDEPNPDLH